MNDSKQIDAIKWLGENIDNRKLMYHIFGTLNCSLYNITSHFSTEDIIKKITDYENNKSVKAKFDRRFRYCIYDTDYNVVDSGIIEDAKNNQHAWTKARLILDEYLIEHPYGEYAVDVDKFSVWNREYEDDDRN